jgi:hypothetical protein
MTDAEDTPRRSIAEEAAELVEAVRTWSASPEVRAQLATASSSLLEAGAALLDAVAERKGARESGPEPPAAPDVGEAPSS